VQLVRWCLMVDPLERPQSLFALQKVLQAVVAPAPELPPPAQARRGIIEKLGGGLRGLVGRLGGAARPKAKAGPDTLV
jgi:hypothetical protein